MLSIVEFSPKRGPVGTSVKIFGSEFSSVPSENKVTFARAGRKTGVSAAVVSAAPTVLVVKVPPGAASGPVTISAPGGNGTSGGAFLVESDVSTRRAPVIREVVPEIAGAGTEVTIKGADFDPSAGGNTVLFNHVARGVIVSATATEVVVLVPPGARSGRLALSTAAGAAESPHDFFVPPPPYTAADVAFTGRLTVGGAGKVVVLNRPDSFALTPCAMLVFDGAIGQEVRLTLARLTITESDVSVYRPDGTPLGALTRVRSRDGDGVVDLPALTATGSHTIVLDQGGARAGSVTVALGRKP